MGVQQLNIKDAETIRLARDLADASGESITATIRKALEREHREREAQVQQKIARIREISAEFRREMPVEWRDMTSAEIMASIYNADGSFAR